MAFCEAVCDRFTVFPCTPLYVRRDARVERAVWLVRDDINPAARHAGMLLEMGPRGKPGVTERVFSRYRPERGGEWETSEVRRVGKEVVSTCGSRGAPDHR